MPGALGWERSGVVIGKQAATSWVDPNRPSPAGAAPTEILVESLTKSFDGRTVLSGVDLAIRRGEIVAVVGGSGCGKTVLLNHILGQIRPDSGDVFVVDHDLPGEPLVALGSLDDSRLARIHRHWGVVFQRNALFSGSVLDNIALWLREIRNLDEGLIRPIAEAALAAVKLPSDPAFLNASVESLSGGMAKRLAIARALAMEPMVVCYDEPTTGLDPTNAAQIQDLILATHFGNGHNGVVRTTIIITHDKDLLVRLRPRIVMLYNGGVTFDGTFDEFQRSTSSIIRPYFDVMPYLHGRDGAERAV